MSPTVSVVIPAWHSAASLPGCLDALAAQSLTDFEVIVVSSSDESETRRVVETHPLGARFEQSPVRLLPHAARNLGVVHARGRRLAFTDPDCRARPDWLEQLLRADHPFVGGSIGLVDADWLGRGIHRCKFPYFGPEASAGERAMLPTANLMIDRALWARIGPFDGGVFCGDSLLARRAQAAGIPIRFVPEARVEHGAPPAFDRFLRERWQRGREFAASRARLDGWSPTEARLRAMAAPLRLGLALGRTATRARADGALPDFVETLPIQVLGQLLWVAGESRALLEHHPDVSPPRPA